MTTTAIPTTMTADSLAATDTMAGHGAASSRAVRTADANRVRTRGRPLAAKPADTKQGARQVDRLMDTAIVAGVAVLVLIGFVTSYDTLRLLAVRDGAFPGWLAPAVPLSFDLGIVVLSLKVLAAARAGRTAITMRVLVTGLSVASVAANGAASTAAAGLSGRLLHAVPPAMFVICFESVIATARSEALAGQPPRHRRLLVWLLAPRATWRTWRAGILSDTTQRTAADGVDSQTAPPVVKRPPATKKPPRVSGSQPSGPSPRRDGLDRTVVARALLESQPELTAAELAGELAGQGHAVSVRTAQRIKAQVAA
jgi:hypothetical protein